MMNDRALICKAYIFAEKVHMNQKDDDGNDYFVFHVEGVADAVEVFTEDVDVICAAYLHDTIEDTDTTYEDLVREFNVRIADLVMEVTHEGSKDNYGYYFPRLHSTEGILIKLCDRASNISRMSSWNEARQRQYRKRTQFWKDGNNRDPEDDNIIVEKIHQQQRKRN